MDYTELDPVTQASIIRTRLKRLERQHLELSLQQEASSLEEPEFLEGPQQLQDLETSINLLRDRLRAVDPEGT